jgi:hypothetical protein
MRRAGRPDGVRLLALVALAVGAALGLSACSNQGGQDLAQQACVHVHRSVTDYLRATRAGTSPAVAAQLQKEADQELRAALPLAAAANSDDGSWNSLMTTISEGATVDEGHLVPSLTAQCVVADSNPNVNPQSPTGNSSPQNVNPEPASPAG